MGVITVEKHLFYAEAVPYEVNDQKLGSHPQVHLRVRSIRVPWGQGTTRLIGYLDTLQFGGMAHALDLTNRTKVIDFFLGRNSKYPRIIVAPVSEQDVHTKRSLAKKFAREHSQKLARLNFPTHPGPPMQEASVWDNLPPEELEQFARSSSGSRVVRYQAPIHREHTFEFPAENYGEVWFLVDPTYLTKRTASMSTVKEVARSLFQQQGRGVSSTAYLGREREHRDKQKKYFDPDNVIPLGIGFRMRYWRHEPWEQPLWLESVQRRVRDHLAAQMAERGIGTNTQHVIPQKSWYAMGAYDAPPSRRAFDRTPSGRIRLPQTFRPGAGFRPLDVYNEKRSYRPLFVVKANNRNEAVKKANYFLDKLSQSPNSEDRRRASVLTDKFNMSGWMVVPVTGVAYARKLGGYDEE